MIFSDVSQDLLDHCQAAAAAEGQFDRCGFVRASADSLGAIADASVDVVTTRSVLTYVKNKAAALRDFYRVLRPGGRVSLFEPVNRLMRDQPGWFSGYDTRVIGPPPLSSHLIHAAQAQSVLLSRPGNPHRHKRCRVRADQGLTGDETVFELGVIPSGAVDFWCVESR